MVKIKPELQVKYDDIQSQLEAIDEDTDDRIQTEDNLCNTECKLKSLLDKMSIKPPDKSDRTDMKPINNQMQFLQPIKLPCFSENLLEWQHYFNTFNDLIHSRNDLSDIQKLYYLKSSLRDEIEKFWEIEEPILVKQTSHDNSICERNFIENTIRNKDGRFIVTLPRKSDNIKLGDSLNNAKNRFLSLECKLIQDPSFKKGYSNFINEYIDLGHMSELNSKDLLIPDSEVFYLPHHAVFKETSLTTKLRVVFDGSAKSSNGLSLNDTLMIGPTVQQDLFSIILRFRVHNYVITSDITKMYRQILVTQKDSNLQRILWRENPEQDLKHYALRTGTTSASFLATRCLVQIPNACRAILNDYVDDLITGADSVHEIKQLKTNVCILWNNYLYKLTYEVNQREVKIFTKRHILSIISGICDPSGLIGPIIFLCKHFMQSLWLVKCNWDDTLPNNLLSQWQIVYNQLSLVSSINVDRCVKLNIDSSIKSFQLHGLPDASLNGFGCCIYVRITYCNDKVSCNLLCSKSRVAPLKQMTLPRLELCACLLLSRLLNQVTLALNERINEIHLYSDSMIALHWIHGQSTNWKVFVANRVSEIQQLTFNVKWHHIESPSNPADILSRGCLPEKLINFILWWHGPSWLWLLQDSFCWPTNHHFNSTETNVDPQCLVQKRQTVQIHSKY
ncbi:uncharacterized protein LOC142327976 [Lycorma delicatula]|uniref:uncharacterized protein LOC142327976 n=1 Tax=Lycorma delicatula TaxID=130591 RepID=UPI003F515B87